MKKFLLLGLMLFNLNAFSVTFPSTYLFWSNQLGYEQTFFTGMEMCEAIVAQVFTGTTIQYVEAGTGQYRDARCNLYRYGSFLVQTGGGVRPVCPANSTYTGFEICTDSCAASQVYNPLTSLCSLPPAANKNKLDTCLSTSKPIKFTTGNKVLTEKDYLTDSSIAPSFVRHYNSQLNGSPRIGINWLTDIQSQIIANSSTTVAGSQMIMIRPDGMRLPFTYNGSAWTTDADVTDKLTELFDTSNNRTGWIYAVDATSEVEAYNVSGLLVSVTDRRGFTQTIDFTSNVSANASLFNKITDALGRTLNFTYDSSNRIATMTNPQGGVYTYTYSTDGNNNLASVTYPDNTVKTYLYENTTFPNALTGVIDENNSRYMTYSYDSNGRAYDEVSPNVGTNVNHYGLTYNPGISTVVTDPLGASRTYNFTTILGVVKSTGQSQPSGSGCAASAAALSYDANGNISSRTDFNGNLTTYRYDMTRNLETSRTEGLTLTAAGTASTPATGTANSATRTITTSYHPTWRLPLTISEYSGGSNSGGSPAGTLLKTTTDVYDSHGNITSIAVNDAVRALTRTTSITYTYSTAVPGLVLTKVVDGPRTDVSDITTYTYYSHDATCTPSNATPIINPTTGLAPDNLGCRGQLMSMTNALNQTTTYDRYNHHGQVEQMTDANGLVTTNTYDLRQRLLSRNVSNTSIGSQTTTLTYDGVGQVTQLSMPDNSVLNYTYDAAHRLTDVQDTLGNKVHYSLDSEGNRMNETTTDPLGTLAKTLSRSYDQLSRLQTLTGLE